MSCMSKGMESVCEGLTLLGWSGVLGWPCRARRMCLSGALLRMEVTREAAAGRGRPDLGGRLACRTSSLWSSCASSSWTACSAIIAFASYQGQLTGV